MRTSLCLHFNIQGIVSYFTWFSWTAMLLAVFGAKSIPNSSGIGRVLEKRSNSKILKYSTLILGVVDCDPCSGFPGELVVHVVALEDVNPVKKNYKRFVWYVWGSYIFWTAPDLETSLVQVHFLSLSLSLWPPLKKRNFLERKPWKFLPLQCFRWSWMWNSFHRPG